MLISIPKEQLAGETRVAATPKSVTQLIKLGFDVQIEQGAGIQASFSDADYQAVGASTVTGDDAYNADILLKVNAPLITEDCDEVSKIKDNTTLISFIWPAQSDELMARLTAKNINVMAMDCVPRMSRSQSLDALSSMANIGGYRAVIEAAHEFGRFFTGQITAAGKVPPAKVLVIGAGVAGLAAIGAAGSLGAIVRAFDTRLEVKEQITSMGGEFLELQFDEDTDSSDGYAKTMSKEFIEAEMALFAEQAKDVDIIITTALIPGKPAPKLITKEMVDSMKAGSVIVDLAAANGGNCEYCETGKLITTDNNVKVIGYTDLPGRLPVQSSQLYATNLVNLLKLLAPEKDGSINIDFDDEVIRGVTVVKAGELTWPAPPIKVSAAPAAAPAPSEPAVVEEKAMSPILKGLLAAGGIFAYGAMAMYAPSEFMAHFTVFALACVIGYYVVWNVSHSLHTPLMSVTNAISGIIIVGALFQVASGSIIVTILATIATLIATINIAGGFYVTQRMLKMFRK
ncbi:MAG: Re/Si-specific NAD(P)(+) transhydrogenase subunit alpha [Psychrobium sp.]